MQKYQANADKMLEMAQKSLAIDPDDPEALVTASQVLAEKTRDTDLDRDQKMAEAKKDAERALVTVDSDVPTAGFPPEKIDQFKRLRPLRGVCNSGYARLQCQELCRGGD